LYPDPVQKRLDPQHGILQFCDIMLKNEKVPVIFFAPLVIPFTGLVFSFTRSIQGQMCIFSCFLLHELYNPIASLTDSLLLFLFRLLVLLL
jgi:hypothetical protein